MRLSIPTVLLTLGLLGAGLTGVALAPAASAFEPTLTYGACPQNVEPANTKCARLTVPLDWQTPDDGRTTTITLRVIPSGRSAGGGFTFNPGGPGGTGIESGPYVYAELPPQVRERFDFVMWDPRGVGLSGPKLRGCSPKPEPDLPLTGPVDWEKAWSDYAIAMGPALSDCFAKNPDAAPYLGTWQVVRDMEAMRIALGYPKWNFWGMSYGTRIAYTYAKTFPDSLRTLVVDGSLWPQESLSKLSSQQPMAWQTALQVYSSIMGRAQTRKFEQVLEVLDDTYIDRGEGILSTRWTFSGRVFSSLGSQMDYPNIRDAINSAYDALVAEPSAQTRKAAVRALETLDEPGPDASDSYLFSFINCADVHDRPTPEMAGQVAAAAARDYGTTLAVATENIVSCQGLPADYSPPVPSDWSTIELATPPVVVLSLGDRATPWLWGKIMANQYAGSRIINYNSSQHVTYMSTPSRCVNDPVTRYLLRRQLPANNTFCSFVPSPPLPQE